MIATLTSKGQITIPLAIRKRLRLKAGDRLEAVRMGRLEANLERGIAGRSARGVSGGVRRVFTRIFKLE